MFSEILSAAFTGLYLVDLLQYGLSDIMCIIALFKCNAVSRIKEAQNLCLQLVAALYLNVIHM